MGQERSLHGIEYLCEIKLLATQLQGPEKLVVCSLPLQDETVVLEWELGEEGAFIPVTFYHP